MEAYHYFWDPEELEVDDEGFLMFLEDEEKRAQPGASGSATSAFRTR